MEAQRRHLSEARRLYRSALQVDPSHSRSLLGLGQLEARSGNAAAARAIYEQGLEAHPRSVHLLSSLAQLQAQVGHDGWRPAACCLGSKGLGGGSSPARSRPVGLSCRCANQSSVLPRGREALCRPCSHLAAPRWPHPLQLKDRQGERDAWMRLIAVEPTNGHACYALAGLERQEGLTQAAELWYRRGCTSAGVRQQPPRAAQAD